VSCQVWDEACDAALKRECSMVRGKAFAYMD
jgi:hypothetical protein